jgi:hypothetical protein
MFTLIFIEYNSNISLNKNIYKLSKEQTILFDKNSKTPVTYRFPPTGDATCNIYFSSSNGGYRKSKKSTNRKSTKSTKRKPTRIH